MNGINGTGMVAAAMSVPTPAPAGHQAELNYIYTMVDELSRQLADNRRTTEDIVSGLGKIRSRARTQALTNEQILATASDEINDDGENLDALVSILSEALEKANHSRDANANLLSQYANALALMLRQLHEYKSRHVADIAAWHHSYRSQLDEARKENSHLREQLWEMQTHARRANESLRAFRRRYDENEERWDRRVQDTAARQELRFWKRVAMPELEDDDPYWSADDDIIDPAEKERLSEVAQRAVDEQQLAEQHLAQQQLDQGRLDEDAHAQPVQQAQPATYAGLSVGLQKEDTAGCAFPMPSPPPRPLSAVSSTGSTGH